MRLDEENARPRVKAGTGIAHNPSAPPRVLWMRPARVPIAGIVRDSPARGVTLRIPPKSRHLARCRAVTTNDGDALEARDGVSRTGRLEWCNLATRKRRR